MDRQIKKFQTFNPLSDAVDEKHRIRLNPQFFHRIFFGYFDGSDGSLKQLQKIFSFGQSVVAQ
jgi:hypothetical protein